MDVADDIKNKLINIDNKNCIIAEFINDFDESGKPLVQTGFAAWIIEEDDLEYVISTEKEVLIFWPDCDIVSAGILKKRLKQCLFKKYCVKIKAQGEWTAMRAKTNNLINFDLISPTKENRKNLRKKNVEISDDEDNPPLKRTKSMKNKHESMNEFIISSMESNTSKVDYEEEEDLTDPLQSNTKDTDVEDSDEEAEENEDEEEDEMMKMMNERDEQLNRKIDEVDKLKEKVRDLEEEVEKKNSLTKDLTEKLSRYKKLESTAAQHEHLVRSVYKDVVKIKNVVESTIKNIRACNATYLKESNTIEDKKVNTIIAVEAPSFEAELDLENEENETAELPACIVQHPDEKKIRPSLKKSRKKKIVYGQEETTFVITEEQKNRLPRNLKAFSNAILDMLFTKEELAASCVTGVPSNANKDLPVRPPLDKDKMAAARNLCYEWFGQKQKNWKSALHYVAKNKCGDARK